MKSMITNKFTDAISNTAQPRLRNDGNAKNKKKNELCLNITMSSSINSFIVICSRHIFGFGEYRNIKADEYIYSVNRHIERRIRNSNISRQRSYEIDTDDNESDDDDDDESDDDDDDDDDDDYR